MNDEVGRLRAIGRESGMAHISEGLEELTGLNPKQWARLRGKHPPEWLRPENRQGEHCGHCGEPLTLFTRICWSCYQDDAARCRAAEDR